MAGKMLLVNPKRRSRKTTSRRKTTPARRKRRAAPKRRTPARRTASRVRRRTASPARRRRRNPARRGIMGKYLQPAVTGGGTAVGIDVLFGYLPLPDMLSTGYGRHAAKGAAAIALGMFGSNLGVLKRGTAEEMARGALTVYAADMIREGFTQFLPDIPLGYYSPAYVPPQGTGEYMSEYLSGGSPRNPLGYESGPRYDPGMSEYVDPMEQDTSYVY